jgi:hypothetical protein
VCGGVGSASPIAQELLARPANGSQFGVEQRVARRLVHRLGESGQCEELIFSGESASSPRSE